MNVFKRKQIVKNSSESLSDKIPSSEEEDADCADHLNRNIVNLTNQSMTKSKIRFSHEDQYEDTSC